MNRIETLLRTPAVTLSVFDHPPGEVHDDPAAELASHDTISFVETGTFAVHAARAPWRFAPGMLFVTRRGMEFACRHDHQLPDDRCLSVSYAEHAVEELLAAGVPAIRPSALHEAPRHRFLRHRLRSCAPGDELRLELIAGALFESLAPGGAAPRVRLDRPVTDVMRRIDRAAQLIETEYARPLALRDLAGAAGMSAYHFARVFRQLTGLPPHRYLTAVRLRQAAFRLGEGASVTRTCYDVGFASLSHFITTFRRRFGIAPSELRHAARAPALRAALAAPVWTRRALHRSHPLGD